MRVRLWGTRGSIPSTLHISEIEAKLKATLLTAGQVGLNLSDPNVVDSFVTSLPFALRGTTGGDTSCLEVRSKGNLIIFDCGSGMRLLGQSLMKEEFGRGQGVAHIFLCHTHWDHMMGWPFFIPAYIPGNQFYIYGVHPDLEARFRLQQTAPSMFPISLDYQASKKHFVILEEEETIEIGQTRVSNMRFHHPGHSYGYRVEDDDSVFIYAGDSEYKTLDHETTRHAVEFFRDANALVFDAMFSLRESYQKEDWGHSSAIAGADLATRAGVRQLLLFHHDPYATDEEIWSLRDQAQKYLEQHPERPPCQVIVAYDGLELELWREATLETSSVSQPEGVVLQLKGRLVAETTPVVIQAIKTAIQRFENQPIAIDLTQVVHLGPKGINALLTARRQRTTAPIALCGLSPEHRRALIKAGALEHFATADSPQAALSTLRQGLELQPGHIINDRYKIRRRAHRHYLGDNYLATDRPTGRQVNLLVLCPSLGPAAAGAILKAAHAASSLRHPFIADILEAGLLQSKPDPIRYVTSEYTQGRSLRQIINSRATPDPTQALHIGLQIAQALEYAHNQGIVHGALVPEDILVLDDDTIKIVNWGIGWLGTTRPLSELPIHPGPLDYLAPEQLQGYGASMASDLYALGTILYEMLAGSPPFVTNDQDEDWIALQLRQPPVPPRRHNPGVSRSLDHLILSLLHKNPRDRPPNVSTVSQLLSKLAPLPPQGQLPGRDAAQQKLRQQLKRVAQGQSAFVLMCGPRGIGKTHLTHSAIWGWSDTPLIVLHAELYAAEPSFPYKPFLETLQAMLLDLPAHRLSKLLNDMRNQASNASDGDLTQPLTTLMPGLRPAMPTYGSSHPNFEQLEDAICKAIRLLTIDQPAVLVMDGMQWTDAASSRLLQRLVQERIPRLLIIGLCRTTAPQSNTALHQALQALTPWVDERIELKPLGPTDVHLITSALKAPSDLALWLYSQTEGNPVHIEQLVHIYQEGPARAEGGSIGETSLAITLEEAILRRLERLSEGVLSALRQAAVLGHHFSFNRLLAALDQPEQQVLAHLDSALRAGFLCAHATEDRYQFEHPAIREVIYTEMLSELRKRYHRRAARAIEQEGTPSSLDARIDILAYHYLHAGQYEKALEHLARAIRRSRTLCAYSSAIDYVDQALAVLDELEKAATEEHEHQQRQKQRADLLAVRSQLEGYITA